MASRVDRKERKTLKVKTVGTPTKFGESGEKLAFSCEDGLSYECFYKTLFEPIAIGAELDADTELRIVTGNDGQEYPHWIVTQLYKEGQPIKKAKPPFTGSKRDEDRTDARTAAMEIGQDWRAGKLPDKHRLVLARKVWMLRALNVSEEDIKKVAGEEALKPIQKELKKED